MATRVLVAYSGRYGSTEEIAQAIADVISKAGMSVDVDAVSRVKDIGQYGAVVLGTSIRMGRPLKDVVGFARRHREGLARVPVAVFSVGVFMREDTPAHREGTRQALAPLLTLIPNPVSVEFFAGKIDYARLGWLLRFFASRDKSGAMREGDWRNWDAIRAWAASLVPRLG